MSHVLQAIENALVLPGTMICRWMDPPGHQPRTSVTQVQSVLRTLAPFMFKRPPMHDAEDLHSYANSAET